jgi:hypothetical protein
LIVYLDGGFNPPEKYYIVRLDHHPNYWGKSSKYIQLHISSPIGISLEYPSAHLRATAIQRLFGHQHGQLREAGRHLKGTWAKGNKGAVSRISGKNGKI